MQGHRDGAPVRRGPDVVGWVARLLVFVGIAALAWSAAQLVEARMYQWSARRLLESLPPRIETLPGDDEPGVSRTASVGLTHGMPLGELFIPRVHLAAVILHGSDAKTLRRGLGHIENTAMPGGASGNVGIAGHRDSFFRPLRNVQVGDDVLLDTPGERLLYRVTSLRVVGAREVSVLEPTGDATLTLVTCYPFGIFGHAPDRFVVRASRVTGTAASPPAPRAEPEKPSPAPRQAVEIERPRQERRSDDAVVREIVERFRVIYNARLVRRGELRPDGPLVLHPCDVRVEGDGATATCDGATGPGSIEPDVWIFGLGSSGQGWTIQSITRR